jgi:hypothetical protein
VGDAHRVVDVAAILERLDVFNFEVQELHNYFVGSS